MKRSVVIASGAEYRRPPFEGLGRFEGRGINYWASPIEARLCRNEPGRRRQFSNGNVPMLIDLHGPYGPRPVLTGSASILIYLAEKSRTRLPASRVARARAFEHLIARDYQLPETFPIHLIARSSGAPRHGRRTHHDKT
jgi:glutathione S-transferase